MSKKEIVISGVTFESEVYGGRWVAKLVFDGKTVRGTAIPVGDTEEHYIGAGDIIEKAIEKIAPGIASKGKGCAGCNARKAAANQLKIKRTPAQKSIPEIAREQAQHRH